jgi:hypothetical protein
MGTPPMPATSGIAGCGAATNAVPVSRQYQLSATDRRGRNDQVPFGSPDAACTGEPYSSTLGDG